jgi:hypothetical protein
MRPVTAAMIRMNVDRHRNAASARAASDRV